MTNVPSIFRRVFCGTLVALLAALLLFPWLQHAAHWPADKKLSGIRTRTDEFPALTVQTWLDGSFAQIADLWTSEHVGVRGWLVNLNRQVRYSLFGQVEPAPRRKRALVLGRPPVLFENLLLADALRPPQISPEKMDAFAANLRRTQELLRDQGMAFLVILAPNKALLYPETLPAWARARISETNTDARAFVAALRRHDVPVLDTMTLFRELQPEFPDLVPPQGIHWSHQGTWLAWQRAIPLVNQQGLLPPLPVPESDGVAMSRPSSMNRELNSQLNLFRSPYDAEVPCAYPIAKPPPPDAATNLDVLVVGDSFGFTFVDALARSGLCRLVHFWFYMQTGKEAFPATFDSRAERLYSHLAGIGTMRPNDENGRRMLKDKKLVVFVVTTFNIDKFAWGFDRLVARLYGGATETIPEVDETEPEVNLAD